jgi:16S rRNA (uracil1498-N3)-methyltransferase
VAGEGRVNRFFLTTESFRDDTVTFPRNISHQLSHVLRLRPGDHVVALDGAGMEAVVELTTVADEAVGRIVGRRPNNAEPVAQVHVFPAIIKAMKLELVFQKCTEIGAASITPVRCERSVAEFSGSARCARFETIVREAAEQSGRGLVPIVGPTLGLADAFERAPHRSLVFSPDRSGGRERAIEDALTDDQTSVGVFLGPEGGFTDGEIDLAETCGHELVSLGPRVLRAETAAIVATALVIRAIDSRRGSPAAP